MKLNFKPTEPFPTATLEQWRDWRWQFKNALSTASEFSSHFELSESERRGFQGVFFQVRSTPYYVALSSRQDLEDPLRKMILPRQEEHSSAGQQVKDPLGELRHSPIERVIHRYPDRILFLVTDQCSLYCRYCLRKHFTAQEQAYIGSQDYEKALDYFRQAHGVREIILSGGDPLTLGDARLERLLSDLRKIEHIEIIRIASRMPVVCPMRITSELVQIFKRHKPVYFMTHFNHPKELSAEAAQALELLVDNGVPTFNQMVLLNGINNHPAIVQALARRLLYLRVKPYYMFQCDPSQGTEHFRTSVEESLEIQRELWGRLSGLAMANLSLDIPGGGGKVGLVPDFQAKQNGDLNFPISDVGSDESDEKLSSKYFEFTGFDGVHGSYKNPVGPSITPSDVSEYMAEWNELKGQAYGR